MKLDKQVIRFNAYFTEAVPESRLESTRVRVVQINYHLEDNTLQLNENKQTNSGTP